MDERPEPTANEVAVARYKSVLQRVMESRPSGTRQRLATALGKNRSFISQITNPSYATPIPARHVEVIFDICHFSPEERKTFRDAYAEAHPRRLPTERHEKRSRSHTIHLPDLGDERKNRELDRAVAEFVERLAKLIDDD